MGAGEEQIEMSNGLRRSGRKRKVKRDEDFDYDYHREDPTAGCEPIQHAEPSRTPTPETSRENSFDSLFSNDFHNKTESPKGKNPRKTLKLDVSTLKPEEIIDTHCDLLEQRLKRVAYNYLEALTPQIPKIISPRGFEYTASEPDDVAVKTVLNNVLRAISLLH